MAAKKPITINWDKAGLGERLDSEIAKDFNVPRRRVTKERAKRNIAAYTKSHPNVKVDRTRRVDASQPATKPITQVVAQSPILSTPKTPKVEKKTKLKNYIAVVLDKSYSIQTYGLEEKLRQAYNELVDTIKKNAEESGQETVFSLFQFYGAVDHTVVDVPASKIEHLNSRTYRADGSATALLDAVGAAISYLKSRPDAKDENVSHLVVTLTDGEENASQTYRPDNIYGQDKRCTKLSNLITECQYAGNWTLTFQLPHGFKDKFAKGYGIPADNIREWAQTDLGVKETFERTSSGVTQYFNSRASGQSRVQSFYCTTDLSKVSVRDIKKKLDDISNKFKSFVVDKEVDIKEFVEAKTKRAYVVGAAYYTLMKTEEIQPQKQVLIRQKGHLAVWGGDEARKLIGLPQGIKAKVTPGNHSEFDVFVQSTSVNRKLPRGTQVLVDMTKLTNDQETWASGYTGS